MWASVVLLVTLASIALFVILGWVLSSARTEGLLVEGFSPAKSVLYITHRHRLCIDLGSDGWDAAVPPGVALAWRALRDAGVTVGLPCLLLGPPSTVSTLRYSDAVSLSMCGGSLGQGVVVATSVPGASKVLVLMAAVTKTTPASVDQALAAGMRVAVGVADEVTAGLVGDLAYVAGWPMGRVIIQPLPQQAPAGAAASTCRRAFRRALLLDEDSSGTSLVDALDAVSALTASSATTLECVALWISPQNEFAFADAPQLRGRKLCILAYDECFDGEDGDSARARLRRRRPLVYTTVLDTQLLLPDSSVTVDNQRRLTTSIASPVLLCVAAQDDAAAADLNPLVALVVRDTAAAGDGESNSRATLRATVALNTAVAMHFDTLPGTAAWMAAQTAVIADDVDQIGAGGAVTYSIYDANGGPLEPAAIPRRAVLQQ